MSKKHIATLEVYIDDSLHPKQPSGVGSITNAAGDTENNYWEIVLNRHERTPDGKERMDLLGAFAHELGHFAAQALKTPAAQEDNKLQHEAQWTWRQKVAADPFIMLIVPEQEAWKKIPAAIVARYRVESEAWDIARRMGLTFNEGQAEQALDTYREGVRLVEQAKAAGKLDDNLEPIETEDSDTGEVAVSSALQTAILPESIMRLIEWQTGERLFWDECERTSDTTADELLSEEEEY